MSDDETEQPKIFEDSLNSIQRGDDVNLMKKDPSLRQLIVAAGWEMKTIEGDPVDVDMSCFLLGKDDLTRKDTDFVFYNNVTGSEGAVRHTGDSRSGAGDGDDETIIIDLNGVPFDIMKIIFCITIHDGDMLDLGFNQVRDAFLRIMNYETGQELIRYDLDNAFLNNEKATGLTVGAMVRDGPKWHFQAIGELAEGGLGAIATRYGIIIAQ